MRVLLRFLLPLLLVASPTFSFAKTVVFWQPGFPAADSPAPSEAALRTPFGAAEFADAGHLGDALARPETDLLVLPYGSAWPEADWDAILKYLDRGGNLMALGGKPFTRAAFQDASGWHLRAASVAQSLELFIHDYQETPGSRPSAREERAGGPDGAGADLTFTANPDVFPALPAFGWKRAFSPVIRLSVVDGDATGGHTGYEDMDLTTLAWGERAEHKLAAPVLEIDHNTHRFVGGRWILVACEPDADFFSHAELLAMLAGIAVRERDRFSFRPRVPLFLPGEPLEFSFKLNGAQGNAYDVTDLDESLVRHGRELRVRVLSEDGKITYQDTIKLLKPDVPVTLPPSAADGPGFHTVEATLTLGELALRVYRSGFWMRDFNYLLTGPKLTVGSDYFQLDGKPLPVVGTTYMSSDVSRMYLMLPNAYVWNQDLAQIRGAGLNMIRTGLWTAWANELAPDGTVSEDGLRTIEAFLMCARHAGLPVQFNLFSFYPDTWGGENGYLDPVALAAETKYAQSLVAKFHDVPFLAWDLINEPSANKNEWRTLPDYDSFEKAAWAKWLAERYPDRAKYLHDIAEPSLGIGRDLQAQPTAKSPEEAAQDPLALPQAAAFAEDAVRSGFNPLKDYDYWLFTQSMFDGWVQQMRAMIRGTGSQQLVTVGQDEGGVAGRLSPAFYGPDIDFTADHTWWDYDAILWASLAPKFPGKPLLIQETGEQRRLTMDDHLRLSAEEEGWQLERKLAISFAQGAGALEWVWNVNAYMANDNEIPIGAVRPDGTEKPEARVLAGFATFVAKSPQSFTKITPPDVTMVTSQTLLYSVMGGLALDAQKKALRTMAYYEHTPLRMLPENRLAELGNPKVVFLPSPQGLSQPAWDALMDYVTKGGTLLVTGPVNRDEHWQPVDRLTPFGIKSAEVVPLMVRGSELHLDKEDFSLQFPAAIQQSEVETLRLPYTEGHVPPAGTDYLDPIAIARRGSGKVLWVADPVEFADDYDATAAVYRWALEEAGVVPAFKEVRPLSPDVLAFPTLLDGAILYSFSNESAYNQVVDITDTRTGANIRFGLQAQRGAAVLLDLHGKVLSSYGVALALP
jgi:Cellulase (glycosyl hydrolase family 5)